MATGEAIVKGALDQLKSTLTSEDVRMFSNTSLEDLWREARKVEQEQGARLELRFMRRLEPFLQTMESYGSVIEVFCQGYSPMAFVWGPIKLMLLLARNHLNVIEKILQAFSEIADILPRLDRLKATFPTDVNFSQVVGLIYSDIIEFHQRTYKFFRRRAWHFCFAAHWGLFEHRFQSILDRLELHCKLVDKEAAAAHYFAMKQSTDKRQLEVDAFEEQRQNKMGHDVFTWLSADEDGQQDYLHRTSDKRQPETCNWVLEDPQMRPWIEDGCGDAVLWMTGIPGAGKSFLCSLIIEYLQTQQRLSTLYYFCDHQSSSANKLAIILRTLTFQLLQQNLDMVSLIHQEYLPKGSNLSGPAMRNMLIELLSTSKGARIIIDGIDECDHATQREVLKSLIDIQKKEGHSCKLLVSSRDEPQIQKSLAAKTHLRLGEQTVKGLSLYIKERLEGLKANFPGMNPGLVNRADQRLHSKANGMFLWVRLMTDMLTFQTSELEIEHAIDQLPEGLDKAYGLIKSRIDSLRPIQLRQRAFIILYWVCVARRPLSLHEIADGLVLHPGQTALNRKTRSNNPTRDIIEFCAPLLERLKNDVVDLVHFSAKEYFIHEQSGPFIDVAKAHFSIAFSCVINLTSCMDLVPRATDVASEEDLESRVVQGCYGLHSYGQDFWTEHVLSYLGEVGDQSADARELIGALEAFSQVWKHRVHTDNPLLSTPHTAEVSLRLNSLRNYPTLHRFVSGWLHFKSEFNRTRATFHTVDAQEQWKLRTDETFLSLIGSRLCSLTERLLMMQSSQLPLHIHEGDFKLFVSRFNFPCRFQSCNHHYDTVSERCSHELSHALYFPCLQCDFSGRGFRSRKDLEKHTHKYHMSPEDFEIPDDLHSISGYVQGSPNSTLGTSRVPSSRSGRWTERGRKALEHGFDQVVARLDFELEAATGEASSPGSKNMTSAKTVGLSVGQHTNATTPMTSLESIRHNIKNQKYDSLSDFKGDLSAIYENPTTASTPVGDRQLESICDEELEKAMSAFPAFANFDHAKYKRETDAVSTSSSTEQLQRQANGLNKQDNDKATPSAIFFGTRVPYWSLPEQQQVPKLLQRCGRDFLKIADLLKTKTPEEVRQHFTNLLSSGNKELSESADLADARLEQEVCSIGSTIDSRGAESEMQPPTDLAHENSASLLQLSQPSRTGLYFSQFGNTESPRFPVERTLKKMETNGGSVQFNPKPTTKKRHPRPRALCPHCSIHKDGLHDEYALKIHIERAHTATRKIWICEDISFNRRFLVNCKSCSASKRYSSKLNARKHLRKVHFDAETSAETLQRWMRETDEPNPNFRTISARSALTTMPPTKRQKTQATTISLPPLDYHADSPRTLPPMVHEMDIRRLLNSVSGPGVSSSVDNAVEEEEEDDDTDARYANLSSPEAEFYDNDAFLEDISFDDFLPGIAKESHSLNDDGPLYRTNRALIKPDQISRLPNLDHFRKTACLDQVDALYHKLDNFPKGTSEYQEALENLTSLSRSLMRNLRDWQRHSTLAPNIPFPI